MVIKKITTLIPLLMILTGCMKEFNYVTLEYTDNVIDEYIKENYPNCKNCKLIAYDKDNSLPIEMRPELNSEYKFELKDSDNNETIEYLSLKFEDTTAPTLEYSDELKIQLETNLISGITINDNYDKPEDLELYVGHHDPYSVGKYYIDLRLIDSSGNKTLIKDVPVTVTGEILDNTIEFGWDELSVRPILSEFKESLDTTEDNNFNMPTDEEIEEFTNEVNEFVKEKLGDISVNE